MSNMSAIDAWGYHFPQNGEKLDPTLKSMNIYNGIGFVPGPSIISGVVRLVNVHLGKKKIEKLHLTDDERQNWDKFFKHNILRAALDIGCAGPFMVVPDIVVTIKRERNHRKGYITIPS